MGVKEVAQAIDRCYATTLSLITSGKIRAVLKGGRWEVSEEEVERFKKEGNWKEEYDAGSS